MAFSGTFTATGQVSSMTSVRPGDQIDYTLTVAVAEGFIGTVHLQKEGKGGQSFENVATHTGTVGTPLVLSAVSSSYKNEGTTAESLRLVCDLYDTDNSSDDILYVISETDQVVLDARLEQGEIKTPDGNVLLRCKESGIELPSGGTGTSTNDDAAAGQIGEFVEATFAIDDVAAATGVFGDMTSISLTAGDWEVTGGVHAVLNSATVTGFFGAISVNSGSTTTDHVSGENQFSALAPTASISTTTAIIPHRLSLAATTTVYLKSRFNYSAGTPRHLGYIKARRVR